MSKGLIEFELENGGILTVEGVSSENGRRLVARGEDGAEKATK
jgi:hypothetical protein